MDDLIAQMRRDFNRLAAFRIDSGEWQQQDAEELGLTIRALITGNDEDLIRSWATWCAEQSASYHGPIPPRSARCAHACTTCRHLTRPGRAEPGYCAKRPDLPAAYGAGHPLHCLPTDKGATCPAWSQS